MDKNFLTEHRDNYIGSWPRALKYIFFTTFIWISYFAIFLFYRCDKNRFVGTGIRECGWYFITCYCGLFNQEKWPNCRRTIKLFTRQ